MILLQNEVAVSLLGKKTLTSFPEHFDFLDFFFLTIAIFLLCELQ